MKVRKFIKTIPMKLYLLLGAIFLFSFFSNDFGLVDIQKTAVILAAGIDKTENGFMLTAQIAVPKGVDRTSGGTSSIEVEAEGETVSICVTRIFSKTGWVPKFVFCNLILLGEEAVKDDVISELNYFLRNEYMNDSCLLAVCEGTANELLSSKSAVDETSSLAIVKLFSDAAEKSGKVMPNNLKDFSIGYYGVSKSSYLPFVRATSQQSGSGAQAERPGGGSGGSSDFPETEKIYSAEETALFSEGKMVALLPPEQTLALSLLNGNVFTGTFDAKDGDTAVTLTVINNKGEASLDMKGAPKAKLILNLTLRLCCTGTTAPVEDVTSENVKPEILESAKQTLSQYVMQLWNTGKESGCDLFNLRQDLYRSSLKKYNEWKDFLLAAVEPEIHTELRSIK